MTLSSPIRALTAAVLLLSGCDQTPPQSHVTAAPESTPMVSTPASVDAWLGKWSGPEGTYLVLSRENGTYQVTVRNLDGERSFAGEVDGGAISFLRDGQRERIYATDGPGTGMKWLADKQTCLAVRVGEGYCRD